ncbi:MAG: S1 family peptidase [Candidatus Helarchaeota archaeon]
MMKPTTITEKLLFSTIRLQTSQGVGTGFYFLFELDNNKKVPVFITNKHVISKSNEKVSFSLHFAKNDQPLKDVITVAFEIEWIFHNKYDLAFTFANPLLKQIKQTFGKDVFVIPLTEDLIWDNERLKSLTAVENVLMYGYPIGLYDKENVLPLIRSGVTASHPGIDFCGEKIGVVDMACFPGSSGSPILIVNEGSYTNEKKRSLVIGSRIVFLGILFRSPIYNSEGKIVIKDIPTRQEVLSITPQMINLGYYIKSEVILDFKEKIGRIMGE